MSTQNPTSCRLTAYQGATFRRTYTFKDAGGLPVNLDGYTLEAKMRPTPTSEQVTFSFTATSTGAGERTIQLTANQSATIALGVYYLGVGLCSPGGEVIPIEEKQIEFKPYIPRS